jgi:thymidylate synthase
LNHSAEADNVADLYEKAIFNIFKGDRVNPRGMQTFEILNAHLTLTNVMNNVLISPIRDLNYRFMVAEWLWILYGRDDVISISRFNKKIAEYSDDGVILNGAYGPRINRQWPYIRTKFKEDANTRQAVMTIWSPNPQQSRDIPCTVSLQFIQRDGKLHCIANMRSSDAWWGLPYDLFVFSQMTNYFAFLLQYEPGSLSMNLGSSHLYEPFWNNAVEFMGSNPAHTTSPRLTTHAPTMLNHILHGEDCGDDKLLNDPAFRAYGNVLCSKTKSEALGILIDASTI